MFFGIVTLFCTAIGILFTACSQYPGTEALSKTSLPLTAGFSRIFNITPDEARWLSFPALYANFYGFVWACGKQLSSMAKSGLLPEQMGYMTSATDTPYVSLIVGMILSMSLALISYNDVINIHFKEDVKYMYMLSSYVISAAMFVSYIVFKQKYSSLPRSFTSPVGLYGAGVGLLIFWSNAIAIVIFLEEFQLPLVALTISTVLMAIYYFMVLDGNQQFSEEEKEKLFKAYLINGKLRVSNIFFSLTSAYLANLKSRAAQKKQRSPTHKNRLGGGGGSNPSSPRGGPTSPRNRSRAASNCSESNNIYPVTTASESCDGNSVVNTIEKPISPSKKNQVAPDSLNPDHNAHHQEHPHHGHHHNHPTNPGKESQLMPVENVDHTFGDDTSLGQADEEFEQPQHVEPSRHHSLMAQLSEKVASWMEEYRASNRSSVVPVPITNNNTDIEMR